MDTTLTNEQKNSMVEAISELSDEIESNTKRGAGDPTIITVGNVNLDDTMDTLHSMTNDNIKKKKAKTTKSNNFSKAAKITRMKDRNNKRKKMEDDYRRILDNEQKELTKIREMINTFTNENMQEQITNWKEVVIPSMNNLPDSEDKNKLLDHANSMVSMLESVIDMSFIEDIDVVDMVGDDGRIVAEKLNEEIRKFRKVVEESSQDFIDPLNIFNKDFARIDFTRVPMYVAKLFRYFNSLVVDGELKHNISYMVNKMIFKVVRALEDVLVSIKKVEGIEDQKEDEPTKE